VKSWGLKVSRRQAAEKMLGIVLESGEGTPKAFRKDKKGNS
jgi:hypothetical protein